MRAPASWGNLRGKIACEGINSMQERTRERTARIEMGMCVFPWERDRRCLGSLSSLVTFTSKFMKVLWSTYLGLTASDGGMHLALLDFLKTFWRKLRTGPRESHLSPHMWRGECTESRLQVFSEWRSRLTLVVSVSTAWLWNQKTAQLF